jgi:hypothetical protein
MTTAADEWFDDLRKIQSRMKQLNNATKDNLKEFSQQKLKDLLITDIIKGNLNQYCQEEEIGIVPDEAYSDMNKNFFWFLYRISYSIEESILSLFYQVAVKCKQDLMKLSPPQITDKTIDDVYGKEPFSVSSVKQKLDKFLQANIPEEFYPQNGELLKDGSQTIQKVINQILI